MPLQPRRDGCAALTRAIGGQWGAPCDQPPAVSGRWQFHDHTAALLLCDAHAVELGGDERLSGVLRFYNPDVEDELAG